MIPVVETGKGVYGRISGNPTLISLDGQIKAPLATILHHSWSAEDRARFGVYLAHPFVTPEGKQRVGSESFIMVNGSIVQVFDVIDIPPETVIDGAEFLERVTDEEYSAITGAGLQNAQIGRWLDIFRLRGSIDVASETAIAAKAGLVKAGLLTQERADVIFASK